MNESPIQCVTRLAPSPTGALHLGNARTFLVNWALARLSGWSIVFRVEDLDGPRVKSGADEQAVRDVRWLGIDWDVDAGRQRADLSPYERALDSLRHRGLVYPCRCTRKEIEQAQSAPHAGEHELRYPGTCRGAAATSASADSAWRLIVPDETVEFIDQIAGPQRFNVQQQVGDFVVATKMGLPAYQLAVVVDDARQGVTDVVRGDDLLPSTARQIWLWRMLSQTSPTGATPLPRWWHLPLVYGPDGHRLAKRHGDTRLAWYRDQGVTPQRVIGLLAYWCGLNSARRAMTAAEFRDGFSIERLPRQAVTFTAEDHAWLLA
jgi:glutamyl-tRNA synthetase